MPALGETIFRTDRLLAASSLSTLYPFSIRAISTMPYF
jgi:hypothetical protein